MKTKIIAIAVIAVIVVAAFGVGFIFLAKEKDKEINVLAAVNTEGSGLYIEKTVLDKGPLFDSDLKPIKSAWGGLILGTPGQATIQHVQLQQIVNSMDMSFTLYTTGTVPDPGTVYFVPNVFNAATALGNTTINGGSLWQPQYQKIVDAPGSRFTELALTNDLFPGHACCVVVGFHGYTSAHQDETVRLLAAYVKAVNWTNNALSNPVMTNPDYVKLVNMAKTLAGQNFTESEVKDAMETVTYTYGGSDINAPLTELKGNIASLAEDLFPMQKINNLGFNNGTEFAGKFVDDQYLSKALKLIASGETGTYQTASIRIAVINGDIHQIAIHMAKELGYFQDYGLDVTFSFATNGPGVATSVQNGDSSFGLLGAPPITITVINGELVKA